MSDRNVALAMLACVYAEMVYNLNFPVSEIKGCGQVASLKAREAVLNRQIKLLFCLG